MGCQTEPARNLGQTLEDRSLTVTAQAPSQPFGVPMAEFAGHWVGTAADPLALGGERAAYVFPSGSTSIVLELSLTEEDSRPGAALGSLVFGDGSAPALPSDPNQGYPTDVAYTAFGYFKPFVYGPFGYAGPLPPYEGFSYQVQDALYLTEHEGNRVADGILRLSYDTQELLAPWCEMQQPQANGNGGFSCMEGANYYYEDGECSTETNNLSQLLATLTQEQIQNISAEDWAALDAQTVRVKTPVDCNKLFLCVTKRCKCDEASCWADVSGFKGVPSDLPDSASYAELTLRKAEDGQGLIGVFRNAVFANERQLSIPVGVVHFERAD